MNQKTISSARDKLHKTLLSEKLLAYSNLSKTNKEKHGTLSQAASNADVGSKKSILIANALAQKISGQSGLGIQTKDDSNRIGAIFEKAITEFVKDAYLTGVNSKSCSNWLAERKRRIEDFSQYAHLKEVNNIAQQNDALRFIQEGGYIISPDVVVSRKLNDSKPPVLHASISCKFTLRSDRGQSIRLEASNLIKNRVGRTPHIIAVVGEPVQARISSLLGGGDVDCIYHFALDELKEILQEMAKGQHLRKVDHKDFMPKAKEELELLEIMMKQDRLKDISKLPFDLML